MCRNIISCRITLNHTSYWILECANVCTPSWDHIISTIATPKLHDRLLFGGGPNKQNHQRQNSEPTCVKRPSHGCLLFERVCPGLFPQSQACCIKERPTCAATTIDLDTLELSQISSGHSHSHTSLVNTERPM